MDYKNGQFFHFKICMFNSIAQAAISESNRSEINNLLILQHRTTQNINLLANTQQGKYFHATQKWGLGTLAML